MTVITVCFTNNRWHILAFGLNILFLLLVRTSCELEGGILPHFKVDHQAGKLKITASKDSADITYKNDNVDVVVKPNNKEQAKVILNSMKDNEGGASAKSDGSAAALVREESGQLRSVNNDPTSSSSLTREAGSKVSDDDLPSSTSQLHVDTSNDIGLRRSGISTYNEDDLDTEDHKDVEGSDITWRGRINHASDEPRTESRHVLSALSEIKNLMALSMKPPNLKAFDEPLPDTNDKYLHTAETVVKKVELGPVKKRRTGDVKAIIHEGLQNNTYNDEPSDFEYVQKAKEIIAQENPHHTKPCTGAHCRHHQQEHSHSKSCSGAHCRHEMFVRKEDPNTDTSFDDEYAAKVKEPIIHDGPNAYHNPHVEYESDGDDAMIPVTSHRKSHGHHPFIPFHTMPYHSQGDDEFPPSILLHNSLDSADMQGSHHSHMHNGPDRIFEKDFEGKVNDKEYGVNTELTHHLRQMHPHHDGEQQFHENDYLGDNRDDYDHMGAFHPHGTDDYDLNPYHHDSQLADLPEHPHLGLHEDHDHDHDHDDDDDVEGHNREHDHANYDFDEAKEIKDEEHDSPDMLGLNGKLKDWYKLNAMGVNPSSKLDEPMDGEIVLAANEKAKAKQESKVNAVNKTKIDEKKIESKFEQAGEKPLNSTEAEQAISKLNESIANGLNESTIKAISSFDNATDISDLNKTTADALNSFNTIKFESMTNDSINIQKTLTDDETDNNNATISNSTRSIEPENELSNENSGNSTNENEKSEDQSGHQSDLKKKISSIEKKINSSGDLMKKLEELEKKMNTSRKHNLTVSSKKQLTPTEKELLHITPEDILQDHLPDEDFIILHHKEILPHNGTQRALNASTHANSEKNETLNATSSEQVNANETGSIESVYASIGEPGELNGETSNTTSENKTNEEATGGAPLVEDKHAEQKNHNEKDFEKYWLKLHKTKVIENGVKKFGLQKSQKMKGHHKRRGSNGFKRHKTKENSGFKRHKSKGRY